MEVIAAAFQGIWGFLSDFKVFGVPVAVLIAVLIILSVLISFLKGTKE